MSAARFVVRPHPGKERVHELLDAAGVPLARFEVARDRGSGRAVPVVGAPLAFLRPSAVARTWEVTSEGEPLGLVEKPAVVRERFSIVVGGVAAREIRAVGSLARRRWRVGDDAGVLGELTQGLVRRRWHDVTPAREVDVRPGAADERSLLVVGWILALVETRPASGVRGLLAGRG